MKFQVKTKECHLIVKARCSFKEHLDCNEIDRFSREHIRGFLKPKIVNKRVVLYSGPVGISLKERLKKPISKREFLFLLEYLVVTIKKLKKRHFLLNHLVLDINNVFVNEITKEVQYIYIPLLERSEQSDINLFIESIIYSLKPTVESDVEYVSRFARYFQNMRQFNENELEKYIMTEDSSIVNIIKKNTCIGSGFITNKKDDYYKYYDNKNRTDDEATGLLDDEATGLLDDEATGLLDNEATGLLDDEATGLLDDEATGLLNDEVSHYQHFPSLLRVMTNETIIINKPVFRLGKENSYVDYFVSNNNTVSRGHADVIVRGTNYFIIDRNSKNKTFINNNMLPPNYEVQIYCGDKLKLANEEFIFQE